MSIFGEFDITIKSPDGKIQTCSSKNLITRYGQEFFKRIRDQVYLKIGGMTGIPSEDDEEMFDEQLSLSLSRSNFSFNQLPDKAGIKFNFNFNFNTTTPNNVNTVFTEIGLFSNIDNKMLTHGLTQDSAGNNLTLTILGGSSINIDYKITKYIDIVLRNGLTKKDYDFTNPPYQSIFLYAVNSNNVAQKTEQLGLTYNTLIKENYIIITKSKFSTDDPYNLYMLKQSLV